MSAAGTGSVAALAGPGSLSLSVPSVSLTSIMIISVSVDVPVVSSIGSSALRLKSTLKDLKMPSSSNLLSTLAASVLTNDFFTSLLNYCSAMSLLLAYALCPLVPGFGQISGDACG